MAFLLTAGYMQLFFGYVEVYALYPAGLLLYLYAGLRALGGRWPIVIPALILGFLFALHQAFLVFMPSLLYVGFRLWRDKMSSLPIIVFALLCCFACSFALILICGVTPLEYVGRTGERNFLPLFGETTKDKHYNVFSITHVVDFLNQQLLVAPAAYLAVFWFRRRHFSHYPFLLIAFLFSLGSTFADNAEIGAFRDWDIFSLPSVPLLLWVALIARDRSRQSMLTVCGAALIHTVFWIGVNADPIKAETRFTHNTGCLKGNAQVNASITLGKYYRAQADTLRALEAYEQSINGDPTNPNRWTMVGNQCRELGEPYKAIRFYAKAAELSPNSGLPYLNLGAVYSDLGEIDKAIVYMEYARTMELEHHLAKTYVNLGALYIKIERYNLAEARFGKALEIQPDHPDADVIQQWLTVIRKKTSNR